MDKVERPVLVRRKIGLEFRGGVKGGRKVIELKDVSVAFDEDPVLIGVDLISRGERLGIIGPNGAGKSVLAKPRRHPHHDGGRALGGPSIDIGYLAQNDELPPGASPLGLVRNTRPMCRRRGRGGAGSFLFRYEQVREW